MKPEQFIREYGVEKAREVVEGAPDWATGINCHSMVYFGGDKFCRGDVLLEDLKRLVKSLGIIDELGGIEEVKRIYSGRPFELAYSDLGQAIRDHESIYGGGDE